jgi:hypothetical protein
MVFWPHPKFGDNHNYNILSSYFGDAYYCPGRCGQMSPLHAQLCGVYECAGPFGLGAPSSWQEYCDQYDEASKDLKKSHSFLQYPDLRGHIQFVLALYRKQYPLIPDHIFRIILLLCTEEEGEIFSDWSLGFTPFASSP